MRESAMALWVAVPVLVTSLSRRTYKDGKVVEDLNAYAQATREVGAKNDITVIDLNRISTAMLDKMTQAEADKFDRVTQPKFDRTHLNAYGKKVFGRIVADQLVRSQVELGPDVVGELVKAN